MDEQKLIAILEEILNKISKQNKDKDSFVNDLAMRLYANTNFELANTSEHQIAQTCIRRAKILAEALNL